MGEPLSVVTLYDRRTWQDRRTGGDRRAAVQAGGRGLQKAARQPSIRQIWTALIIYCLLFWGMVGYAIYDILTR
jgi:hypothetical protein